MANQKTEVKSVHEMEIQTGELAAIVGKSARWIRQLTGEGVLKQTGRGKYKLGEAVLAYIEHVQGAQEDDGKVNYRDEKAEHEQVKKEKAKLELARLRGELHRSEDVEAVMVDMLTAMRQKILAIPTKLSPQLVAQPDPNVIKIRLTEAMHEALAELSDYDPAKFREGADVNGEA